MQFLPFFERFLNFRPRQRTTPNYAVWILFFCSLVLWVGLSPVFAQQGQVRGFGGQPVQVQTPAQARSGVRPTFDLGPGGKLTIKDSAFKNGSAAIEPSSFFWFQALGDYLKARPELEIEIRGHASSEGDVQTNQRLSEERANTAKKYLVEVYGIAEARIRTRGFGDSQPLQSNDDERGRAQNRRVEIVGLSSATQKSLTTETGSAASGDGKISYLQGKLQLRAPWELDFHNAHLGEKIFEYHRIITGDNSRAEITFNDNSKIQVYENSSMIIYSPSSNRGGDKPQENVKLIEGNMFVKLNGGDSAANSTFLVKTTGSSISLDTSSARIGIDSGGRSTVAVFGGTAKVKTNDTTQENSEEVELEEGFGFTMQGGKNTKRKIPPAPELLTPDMTLASTLALPSPVLFQWSRRAPLTRIEVARDPAFANMIARQVFSKNDSLSVNLDSGMYYFRLTSIDELNIESKPVEGMITVSGKGAPPVFRVIGFLLFLVAAGLIWGSILANTPFQVRTINSWAVQNQTLQFQVNSNQSNLVYQFAGLVLDHRSLLLIMRSLAALSFMVGMYIVWR